MYRRTALLIISMACFVCTINSANAVTWTAGDLVRAMRQAQANGQPFDRLLAEKVGELLAESGLKIVDDQLVYSDKLPPTSVSLSDDEQADDYIKDQKKQLKDYLVTLALVGPGMGSCLTSPIPAGSPLAVNSTGIIVNAKFSNSGTYIDLRTQPNQVALTLNVNADLYAETKVGLEWCGFVAWPYSCSVSLVKNPLCPPPYPVPDICYKKECVPTPFGKKCSNVPYPCTKWVTPPCSLPDVCPLPIPDAKIVEERWTDRALATAIGKLKGTVTLTLDHVLTVGSNSITIGAVPPTLSGMVQDLPSAVLGAVVPDTRLISVPVPPYPVSVTPHAETSSVLQIIGTQVNVLAPLMHVTGYSEKLLIRERVTSRLIKQQQERLNAEYSQYFPLTLQLPNFDNLDPASQALLKLVLDYLYANIDVLGEFALDVVRNNWTEVLYYVLTDNRAGLAQLFGYQALCPSIDQLKANMPSGPLYSAASGTCTAVDARNPGNGPFYATPSCTTAIGFQPENLTNYCRESLTAKPNPYLGNAAAWPTSNIEVDTLPPMPNGPSLPNVSSKWSLSTSTQLAVGVEPINNNRIPFMKRINYRQVDGCELEMRVYKKDIAATNLTPLVWVHGGSWTYRSSGFLGMESLVSSYTEDNFVVFAPFYRLAGDKDGNAECRNVTWERVAADVEAAFDWVKANGASLGADTSGKIAVTGQSSGAFLAAWLMTHRADKVSRGLLVYPPTDLNDFLTRLQRFGGATFPPLSDGANTPYDPSQGQEVIETYLGLPKGGALAVNLNSPPAYLPANSLAKIVADSPPSAYPPAFILHGTRDSLLTYSQSQVLCEAYGGVVNVDWLSTADLRAVFACGGDRGQLHLFKEAGHVFEVCPFTNIAGACRAGSPASAGLLTDSIQKGRRWLLNREFAPLPVVNVSASANDAGNLPANTGDNNFGTRWSAPGNGQWIQYDLGVARGGVNAVAIAWYRGNARIARFAIQTSMDGATWQNVYSGQSSGTSVDLENVVIPPGSARFVRIVGYGNNLNLQNSIVEARIYSNTPPRRLTPVLVSASAVDNGNVPENTIDNDLSTRWSASGDGQWIQYDLGAKKYITTLGLAWYRGDRRQARFDIYTSVDGANWTSAILGATSNGTTLQEQLYDFNLAPARYVRIVGHGNTANLQNGITETDIYGVD